MIELHRKKESLYIGQHSIVDLAQQFHTPLYLYSEAVLRHQCQKLKKALPDVEISYSAKANSNVSLLKIIKSEGIGIDAMSVGEIIQANAAGYASQDILFVSNNVSAEKFSLLAETGIERLVADSLDQMRLWLKAKPGAKVILRLNPSQGAGHHSKVITAGKVKFGLDPQLLDQAVEEARALGGSVNGLMIHIGSLFLSPEPWLDAIDWLLEIARGYPGIEYLDFGGGLGVTYDRTQQADFPLEEFGTQLALRIAQYKQQTQTNPIFAIEPGRFLVAECGCCVAQVQSTKTNNGIRFVGTDLGFNFFVRPEMYGSYHEIIHSTKTANTNEQVQVVGNVCESGDYLGKDRYLPSTDVGDLLVIRDTGAYGFSMSSNYNSMPKPAEVLIKIDNSTQVIRKAQDADEILRGQLY